MNHFWAYCERCKVRHPIESGSDERTHSLFMDFTNNHQGHPVGLVPQAKTYLGFFGGKWADLIRRSFWKKPYALVLDAYKDNADVKEAFQAIQTLAITALSSLANSPTAGWQSAQVDNTSNLYLDALMQFTNTAVNTAAASSKAIFFFAFGGNATGVLTNFGAAVTGTGEATLVFPDITANRVPGLVYVQPYTTQNIAMVSLPFSMAAPAGILSSFWGVAAVNHSGMTLGTVTMKYQGTYNTVI
jgi:hypothetical protein